MGGKEIHTPLVTGHELVVIRDRINVVETQRGRHRQRRGWERAGGAAAPRGAARPVRRPGRAAGTARSPRILPKMRHRWPGVDEDVAADPFGNAVHTALAFLGEDA